MFQLHEETKQVTSKIKNLGYKVIEIWEHEWNQMKKHNKDVKVCVAEVDTESITPLIPRDASLVDVQMLVNSTINLVMRRKVHTWTFAPCTQQ